MIAKLILKDGSEYEGESFGSPTSVAGEVVFATGMVGYPESLTDPSFKGQILVYTYPLIGNYGVPDKKFWESNRLQISGLIVCNYNSTPSHYSSKMQLADWLKKEKIPLLEIKDTRGLTLKLRNEGSMLGKVVFGKDKIEFEDPNERNLVAEVSVKKPATFGKGKKTVALIDCGSKKNILNRLLARGLKVVVVPWNFNPLKLKVKLSGIVISNGPGDPQKADATIANVRAILAKKIPTLGICLGNQILALAAGGTTYKLKFGHRGQNQPCVLKGTKKCYLSTQNHGFAVGKIPKGFKEWFYNANDNTNEGIIHAKLPFMSVQFHPEATPGPTDTDWVFDYFLRRIR
jgi:carbamoyl-phosphate synthase small subunit